MVDIDFFILRVVTCALDDEIPQHLLNHLGSLRPTKLVHPNLQLDGPDYDVIPEEEEEGASTDGADELLDLDGAGADMPIDGPMEQGGDEENDEGSEDDTRLRKRMRTSADAAISLTGLE